LAACVIGMSVELRKIGKAAFPLSSITKLNFEQGRVFGAHRGQEFCWVARDPENP
jgi:hypothetical protein